MGQEKSLPARCNSTTISHHSSAASSTSLNSTKSLTPSRSPSTASTASSSASYKSIEQQKKYLNEHLYIKSYLEIDKEEHIAKAQLFQQIRPGIRNYKPKILKDKLNQEELDVWI